MTIDGLKFFRDLDKKEVREIVVSVKRGGLKADDVRAFNPVREREKAEIGLFNLAGKSPPPAWSATPPPRAFPSAA